MVDDWGVFHYITYISGQDVWSQGICEIHCATLKKNKELILIQIMES